MRREGVVPPLSPSTAEIGRLGVLIGILRTEYIISFSHPNDQHYQRHHFG